MMPKFKALIKTPILVVILIGLSVGVWTKAAECAPESSCIACDTDQDKLIQNRLAAKPEKSALTSGAR